MKCENCNQEGFDALITLAGTGKLYADGWCLDCLKKWSYANKQVKLEKPKIEYFCKVCRKQLFPQNAVTYVYHAQEKDREGYFLCRDHGESGSGRGGLTIIRYTRQMHLESLERLERGEPLQDAIRPQQSLDELFLEQTKKIVES